MSALVIPATRWVVAQALQRHHNEQRELSHGGSFKDLRVRCGFGKLVSPSKITKRTVVGLETKVQLGRRRARRRCQHRRTNEPRPPERDLNMEPALAKPTSTTVPTAKLLVMAGVFNGQDIAVLKDDGCNTNVISSSVFCHSDAHIHKLE